SERHDEGRQDRQQAQQDPADEQDSQKQRRQAQPGIAQRLPHPASTALAGAAGAAAPGGAEALPSTSISQMRSAASPSERTTGPTISPAGPNVSRPPNIARKARSGWMLATPWSSFGLITLSMPLITKL